MVYLLLVSKAICLQLWDVWLVAPRHNQSVGHMHARKVVFHCRCGACLLLAFVGWVVLVQIRTTNAKKIQSLLVLFRRLYLTAATWCVSAFSGAVVINDY